MTEDVIPSMPTKYKRGEHPNSRVNLRPGNPPVDIGKRGYSITAELKHQISEEPDFIAPHARPKDKVWRQQIAREILIKAAQGDVSMVKELLDRTEGKVPDKSIGDTFNINYIDKAIINASNKLEDAINRLAARARETAIPERTD